jgi:hypothetical protein
VIFQAKAQLKLTALEPTYYTPTMVINEKKMPVHFQNIGWIG